MLHSVNGFHFLSSIFIFMCTIRATWQVSQPAVQCLGWACAASLGIWSSTVLKIDAPSLPHNTTVQKYVYLLAIPNCEKKKKCCRKFPHGIILLNFINKKVSQHFLFGSRRGGVPSWFEGWGEIIMLGVQISERKWEKKKNMSARAADFQGAGASEFWGIWFTFFLKGSCLCKFLFLWT